MRVEEAVGFANFLLLKDGWDRDDAYRTLYKQKSQRGMKLKRPVPLVTEYTTVDISTEGLPVFLSDIYGYDKAYATGKLPPREHILWGQPRFRPSWVPLVPEDVVKKWRSQGKAAPRNYNPAIHGGG
ncbi:MAG TPA: hypothetical protein EYN66_24720 [Myxococcales bacterium]|nr:hypothetical protein [Myxococcales bacterium]